MNQINVMTHPSDLYQRSDNIAARFEYTHADKLAKLYEASNHHERIRLALAAEALIWPSKLANLPERFDAPIYSHSPSEISFLIIFLLIDFNSIILLYNLNICIKTLF